MFKKNLREEILMSQAASPIIKEILAGMTSKSGTRRKSMHGSGAGKCGRQSFLAMNTDGMVVQNASSTMYMSLGAAIHNIITSGLYNRGLLLWKEYRVYPPRYLRLGGFVDAIIKDPNTGKPAILEIKSCGPNGKNEPDQDHILQAGVYSLLCGIDDAYILYVNRDGGFPDPKMWIFKVDISKDFFLSVARQIAIGQVAIDANKLPEAPAWLSKSKCKYCQFSANCWDGALLPEYEKFGEAENQRVEKIVRDLCSDKMREVRFQNVMDFITSSKEKEDDE